MRMNCANCSRLVTSTYLCRFDGITFNTYISKKRQQKPWKTHFEKALITKARFNLISDTD